MAIDAKAVKAWRTSKGWSVRHAAEVAGVSPPTWTNYEHGRPVSELSEARILAVVTETPAGDRVADALNAFADELAKLRAQVADLTTKVSENGGEVSDG